MAILGTTDFTVVDVNVNALLFAQASPEKSASEDVNSDGVADLIFDFRAQDLQLSSEGTQATPTGKLRDGGSIADTDSVRIVRPNGHSGKD